MSGSFFNVFDSRRHLPMASAPSPGLSRRWTVATACAWWSSTVALMGAVSVDWRTAGRGSRRCSTGVISLCTRVARALRYCIPGSFLTDVHAHSSDPLFLLLHIVNQQSRGCSVSGKPELQFVEHGVLLWWSHASRSMCVSLCRVHLLLFIHAW